MDQFYQDLLGEEEKGFAEIQDMQSAQLAQGQRRQMEMAAQLGQSVGGGGFAAGQAQAQIAGMQGMREAHLQHLDRLRNIKLKQQDEKARGREINEDRDFQREMQGRRALESHQQYVRQLAASGQISGAEAEEMLSGLGWEDFTGDRPLPEMGTGGGAAPGAGTPGGQFGAEYDALPDYRKQSQSKEEYVESKMREGITGARTYAEMQQKMREYGEATGQDFGEEAFASLQQMGADNGVPENLMVALMHDGLKAGRSMEGIMGVYKTMEQAWRGSNRLKMRGVTFDQVVEEMSNAMREGRPIRIEDV
jgi:hypothetical protein